jgi:hypothetical protein
MNERSRNERDASDSDDVDPDNVDSDNVDPDIVERHLQRAWQAFAPPSNLREVVRARLTSSTAATLGAAGMGLASNARPEGTWTSLSSSGSLRALVGAGLLGIGLLSGYWIRDRQQEAPPPPLSSGSPNQPPPAVQLPVLAEPALQSVEAPSRRASRSPRAAEPARRNVARIPRPTTAPNGPAQPNDELALLRRAERALRTDDAALALALIGELEERYPRSSLLEERGAMELMAYCTAGASDAVARTQRFLRQYPQSAYAGRVRDLCPRAGADSPTPR